MSSTNDSTTLVCLFHYDEQAQGALKDLDQAGIPRSSLTVFSGNAQTSSSGLAAIGVPARDLQHLQDGIKDGGTVIAISALAQQVAMVERIFTERAHKIDETVRYGAPKSIAPVAAMAAAAVPVTGEVAIPIVEEELEVGKREVDRGGVRVLRHIVEKPVEASVNLREEHVVVERHPVNRAVTDADLNFQGNRTIELTETAEEAVVTKSAHVVEEVVVGKQVEERTQHIQDSVRRTEVDVEQIAADNLSSSANKIR